MNLVLTATYLLLPVALAIIKIEVTSNEADKKVCVHGNDSTIVSTKDLAALGLTEDKAKKAFAAYYGRAPDKICCQSPSNTLKKCEWCPVSAILRPVSSRVLNFTTKCQVMERKNYGSHCSKAGYIKVRFFNKFQNTFSSDWSDVSCINVKSCINYNFRLGDGKESFEVTYKSKYGKCYTKRIAEIVRTKCSKKMVVNPCEEIDASLTATKGFLKVEVEYEIFLCGAVAAYYKDCLMGQHHWTLGIKQLLKSCNLNMNFRTTEIINIVYYANPKIELVTKCSEGLTVDNL